ncbi:MAG: DNA-processing protein DprA [Candidatus Latescibacterota bacterium]
MTAPSAVPACPPEERLAWLVLSRAAGARERRCQRLVEAFGTAEAALTAGPLSWEPVIGRAAVNGARIAPELWDWAEGEVAAVAGLAGRVLTLADPGYPPLLRQIPVPPPVLYVVGAVGFDRPAVAVVGPRAATEYGRRVARLLAHELAAAGVCVVSGMAVGVDTAAHLGALEAGGQTLAVLGCGVDVGYPAKADELRRRIPVQGALLSEFALGTGPEPGAFPRRNRIISGLCRGVVVVETPERSGALNTVSHALEQGREVMAVPGSVLDGRSRGCHSLLRQGAVLVEDAGDVLRHLDLVPDPVPDGEPSLDEEEAGDDEEGTGAREIRRLLGREPRQIDDLAADAGRPASELLAALLDLELSGKVSQLPGKWFVRSGPRSPVTTAR